MSLHLTPTPHSLSPETNSEFSTYEPDHIIPLLETLPRIFSQVLPLFVPLAAATLLLLAHSGRFPVSSWRYHPVASPLAVLST